METQLERQIADGIPEAPRTAPSIPRGIAPGKLLEQVQNTVPFLWTQRETLSPAQHYHLHLLVDTAEKLAQGPLELSHDEYFELCVAAHHGTVTSFVPTDVDSQIRFKLWHPVLDGESIANMAATAERSFNWDCSPVSTRWISSPLGKGILTGHQGEWFSTSVGAYRSLRRRDPNASDRFLALIIDEIERESAIYAELEKRGDGVNLLKAATLIAHNLGDLDRVLDLWELTDSDPLKREFYQLGHPPGREPFLPLMRAGEVNKALMADDNHRHFALRPVKPLRRTCDLLLPIGPFFDDWGRTVAKHPSLSPEDVGETVEALLGGYEKLGCVGYARALSGIEDAYAGGLTGISQVVSARTARALRTGELRQKMTVPQQRFEAQWATRALKQFPR